MKLTVIIDGEDENIDVSPYCPVRDVVATVLKNTRNTGRPVNDWELFDRNGVRIPFDLTVDDARIQDSARLFLSLSVAYGG